MLKFVIRKTLDIFLLFLLTVGFSQIIREVVSFFNLNWTFLSGESRYINEFTFSLLFFLGTKISLSSCFETIRKKSDQ